jgi:hypothetical protein
MLLSIAALAMALHAAPASVAAASDPLLHLSQYGVPAHPPPCGNGWDLSARDGLCYPNGYLPPQDQAARRYFYSDRGYRGGRYPVPCGNGADVDIRDGLCYPTGTVPPQFQQGRRYAPYYDDDEEEYSAPRRRYY